MAHQYLQSDQVDQAETLIRQVLAYDPDHANAASALAMIYVQQQKYDLAIEVLDRARRSNPDSTDALIRLGDVYKVLGKFDEAKDCYRRGISLDRYLAPRFHLALATTCRFSAYDDDVRSMEEEFENRAEDPSARRYLAFALGKVFDDLQDYDKAFLYFQEGNRIVAATSANPSLDAVAENYARIKAIDWPDFVARYSSAAISDDKPIFVTGMPRSGTTLVEQILASHPQVHGGGELDKLGRMLLGISRSLGRAFPDGLDTVDPGAYRDVATRYVRDIDRGKLHTADKSISSYIFIGLIRTLLPNAKIVLCKRDPRDMGLSNFQIDLGHSYSWSYRLDWIGRFYRCFDDLTAYWIRCFPGQIHVVQYEDLIADPERRIRALLDHCNLEFDPACLEFHKTVRVVTTASRDQVRKPIYKSSVGRWKNYEKHLDALLAALGAD